MGVRPLDLRVWIDADEDLGSDLALKQRLLAERPDDFIAVASPLHGDPNTAALAAGELEELISSWWAGQGRAGPPQPPVDLHPIARCGLRTQEDWAIMAGTGVPVLLAGCVCFPTRWRLPEKIGLVATDIHRSVAHYEDIAAPLDTFLDRLRPGSPVWRANWNLVDDHERCQDYHPAPGRHLDCDSDDVADLVDLRVERQTLRRLPRTGAIAFGIRVHQRSLRSLEDRPDVLGRLLAAAEALPGDTFAYKGLGAFWEPLREWLRVASEPRAGH